jgi:fructoselysine 6-kinase
VEASVRVAAVGEVAEELYVDDGRRRLGGISVNFARAVIRDGTPCALYAAIGSDDRAARLHAALERTTIAPLHLRRLPGASAEQRIRVAADGERVFAGFEPGVLVDYRLDGHELDELAGYDVVAVPCSPESRALYRQCTTLPRQVALVADFSQDSLDDLARAPERWLAGEIERLSVAFVGAGPAVVPALRQLSSRSDALVVLTCGADGAYAFRSGTVCHQPTLARYVVDTTGCGDAFQGAFVASYFRQRDVARALMAGATAAARIAEGARDEDASSSRVT